MSELKKLTMENFAKGAAVELFNREMEQVLENIDDVNTKADGQREITLKFIIKPDANREEAALIVEAKSKLVPVRHAIGQSYFGRRGGKLVAYSHNINQSEMDLDGSLSVVNKKAGS